MKSARRIAYVQRKHKKPVNKKRMGFLIPGILLLIILLAFVGIKLDTRFWNNHDKFSFAYHSQNGDTGVTVLDPKTGELTTLIIPGETEVDVAMNYGTLRLKNVWQLGKNEKLDGALLAKTVTKNFSFPVFLWSDSDGAEVQKTSLTGLTKFVFFPQKTNIPLGDRVSIAFFALKAKNLDRTVIDLAKSQFLTKQKLSDGISGYKLTGPVSGRLTVYFSDNDMADKDFKVYIVDSTGTFDVAQNAGQIIEVMGGKIVSVDKSAGTSDFGCQVLGKDSKVVNKFVNIFNCKAIQGKTDYDIELRLGTQFAKAF